ncbi:hypothetical protein B0H14DRAFT_1157741 [Mycena olivaceomarginata]|nr:hypothetical protein B0H14DRAFT_1157741 [Mycena olivaceomarginata]
MLLSLLRAAPALTVRRVDVVDDLDVSQLSLQHVLGALRLRIGRGCLGLCRLFAYPQYASLTNGLTHLAINAANPFPQSNTHIIISNASRTLKSLRIQMARATSSHRILSPLTPLPALRFPEYGISLFALGTPRAHQRHPPPPSLEFQTCRDHSHILVQHTQFARLSAYNPSEPHEYAGCCSRGSSLQSVLETSVAGRCASEYPVQPWTAVRQFRPDDSRGITERSRARTVSYHPGAA